MLVHLYADFLHHLQLVDSTDTDCRYKETQASKAFGIQMVPELTLWTPRDNCIPRIVGSYGAQTVKRLPIMWETQVQSLDREDLLEKEMATHSGILVWKIPWTEEPDGL